jgi:integrase-like protein
MHAPAVNWGLRHIRTQPYRLRTNGKAERFQTLLREWAYSRLYGSSAERLGQLESWLTHYNFRRPHGSLGHRPPATRLNNLVGNYARQHSLAGTLPRRGSRARSRECGHAGGRSSRPTSAPFAAVGPAVRSKYARRAAGKAVPHACSGPLGGARRVGPRPYGRGGSAAPAVFPGAGTRASSSRRTWSRRRPAPIRVAPVLVRGRSRGSARPGGVGGAGEPHSSTSIDRRAGGVRPRRLPRALRNAVGGMKSRPSTRTDQAGK